MNLSRIESDLTELKKRINSLRNEPYKYLVITDKLLMVFDPRGRLRRMFSSDDVRFMTAKTNGALHIAPIKASEINYDIEFLDFGIDDPDIHLIISSPGKVEFRRISGGLSYWPERTTHDQQSGQ